MKRSSGKPDETPALPITFRAAEELGAFELAQFWADRTVWPVDERTQYDELAELAVMSALGKWLRRWQPIAIRSAMLAGARPEAIETALGNSLQVAYDRWHEWGPTPTRLHPQRQARHHNRGVRRSSPPVRCRGGEGVKSLKAISGIQRRRSDH